MKSVISAIASRSPNLSEEDFAASYQTQHPSPDRLGPDNLRQAYGQYKQMLRKAKRRAKGITRDSHIRHHPQKKSA